MTAAAARMNVSISHVSTQLADLEMRVGLVLCQRGRGGFSLTEDGTQLFSAVVDLTRGMDEFGERLDAIKGQLSGELRLGVGDSLPDLDDIGLLSALRRFMSRSPGVSIALDIRPITEVETMLLNNLIDVGITVHDGRNEDILRRVIAHERIGLFCARGHPFFAIEEQDLTVDRIEHQPRCYRRYIRYEGERRRKRTEVHHAEANDVTAVRTLILTGLFVGRLPAHVARNDVAEGRLRELKPDHYSYLNPISLIMRTDQRLSKAAEAFVEDLLAW